MQKAKSMLLDGRTVSEVSDALGFEYPQNLTRMFKKEFGLAPSKMGNPSLGHRWKSRTGLV